MTTGDYVLISQAVFETGEERDRERKEALHVIIEMPAR